MHAHIIHAHSEADSFVAAMRKVIETRLIASGATVSQSDLYAMNFNPVLSPADFGARRDGSHLTYALEQRHGYETGTLSPDILAEIEKVLAADLLVFTFPVFWFSVPAILKGWIDRVFISGPFYGGRRIYGAGGLAGKRAVAAFSLGGRDHMFGPGSVHGELEAGMLRHFLQGSLGYVGLQVTEPFVAYHAPYVAEEERTRMLDALATYIERLDEQPTMAMPDLGGFDASLAPRAAPTRDQADADNLPQGAAVTPSRKAGSSRPQVAMKKAVISQGAPARSIPSRVSPPEKGTKYQPLFDYLRRRSEEEVIMPLASVEIVLKTLLPKSAMDPGWWVGEASDHASRSWKAAGFLAELMRGKDVVRFRRSEQSSIG